MKGLGHVYSQSIASSLPPNRIQICVYFWDRVEAVQRNNFDAVGGSDPALAFRTGAVRNVGPFQRASAAIRDNVLNTLLASDHRMRTPQRFALSC